MVVVANYHKFIIINKYMTRLWLTIIELTILLKDQRITLDASNNFNYI